jgi:hypothetical protein
MKGALTSVVIVATGVAARADVEPARDAVPASEIACTQVLACETELAACPSQNGEPAQDVEPPSSEIALERVVFPEARSKPPNAREWKGAKEVSLTRSHFRCDSWVLREWIRVECTIPRIGGAHLLAGNREGVGIQFSKKSDDDTFGAVAIVFPARRRDRRVFQVVPLAGEWDGDVDPPVFVSESWVDGESPQIVVSGG